MYCYLVDQVQDACINHSDRFHCRRNTDLLAYNTPLPLAPAVEFDLPKIKPKTTKRPKAVKGRGNRIDTPSRIPLFYVDIDVEEGTVVLPIRIPLQVADELFSLIIKKRFQLEHVWITAITNALSTLAYSQGLVLPELLTCGWWRDLRTQRPNVLKSPLGRWEGYSTIKMKAYSEPIQPEVFWSEVKTVMDKVKRAAKSYNIIHDAPEQLTSVNKHGINGYNPEQYLAHVVFSYLESHHEHGGTSPHDCVQVDEYMCTRSMTDYSVAPLHVSVTNVITNRMSVVLIYNRKWISREFALTYVENIQALLEFMVGKDHKCGRFAFFIVMVIYVIV